MNYYTSDFYCTLCGSKGIPIMRSTTRNRKNGHLKKLWCATCRTETNHVEIRENSTYTLDDFKKEYLLHNFTKEGLRKNEK